MGKSIFDSALEGIGEIIEELTGSLSKEFKGADPFDREKVSDEEQIYQYETKGYDMFKQIADAKGLEAAVMWRGDMEQLKARRQGNG